MTTINRREVLARLSMLLGAAFTGPLAAGAMGQKTYFGPPVAVSPEQEALLAEAAEVIIPTTATPGAKEAGVEKFITRVVADCYEKKEQDEFYASLSRLDQKARDQFGGGFVSATAAQKKQVMEELAQNDKAFFQQLKSLTVTGYFTSEAGATQALDYLPVPGRFDGSYPLKPEQKTWAL